MSLADEEDVQPLLSEQDVETGQPVEETTPEEGDVSETEAPPTEPDPTPAPDDEPEE